MTDGHVRAGHGGFKLAAAASVWTFVLFVAAVIGESLWPSLYGIGESRVVPLLGGLVIVCVIDTFMLRLSESRHLRWTTTAAWGCVALTWGTFIVSALSLGVFLAPTVVLVTGGMVRWSAGGIQRRAP
ncbi:MAG: hypothetical protein M0T72_08935 [Candidatus Dormibacteraeota bacterium]|nr:hypothetical protein [Candidatus Dormibacteraeota bacterium]